MKLCASIKRQRMICLVLLIVLACVVLHFINYRLQVTNYTIADIRLPIAFDGFKVVHVSDLHGASFGREQAQLIAAICEQKPDLVVLTGDIVDRKNDALKPVEDLLRGIYGTAPIFSVSGNHETSNLELYEQLKELYATYGVTVLEKDMVAIVRQGTSIYLGGVDNDKLSKLGDWSREKMPTPPEGAFSLFLYHGSNQYETIVSRHWGYAYLFSGHTHGGIIRLPFLGGLIDNDWTLFPQYDGGLFLSLQPGLISSRGLGDSSGAPIPRINNRPELVCVTFTCP